MVGSLLRLYKKIGTDAKVWHLYRLIKCIETFSAASKICQRFCMHENERCRSQRDGTGQKRSVEALRKEPIFCHPALAKERRSSNARLALWQGLILRQKIGLAGAHRAVLASLVPSASRKNNQRRLSATALKALPAASIVRSMSSSLCAPDMKSVSNCDGAR